MNLFVYSLVLAVVMGLGIAHCHYQAKCDKSLCVRGRPLMLEQGFTCICAERPVQ